MGYRYIGLYILPGFGSSNKKKIHGKILRVMPHDKNSRNAGNKCLVITVT